MHRPSGGEPEDRRRQHHRLIHDEAELRRFGRLLLASSGECGGPRLVFLLARDKYTAPDLRFRTQRFKRSIVKPDRVEAFVRQMLAYEAPVGSYVSVEKEAEGGTVFPDRALALYITLNPKSVPRP